MGHVEIEDWRALKYLEVSYSADLKVRAVNLFLI